MSFAFPFATFFRSGASLSIGFIILFSHLCLAQCHDVDVPGPAEAGGQTFSESEASAGAWLVRSRDGIGLSQLGSSLGVQVYIARLTLGSGNVYFRYRLRDSIDEGVLTWSVEMWDAPPSGVVIVRSDEAEGLEAVGAEVDVVLHAPSLVARWVDAGAWEKFLNQRQQLRMRREVVVDKIALQRHRFAFDIVQGVVRNLAVSARVEAWPNPVFVSQRECVYWLDMEGVGGERVPLSSRRSRLEPFEVALGQVALLDIGGGGNPVGVLDLQGGVRWEWTGAMLGLPYHRPTAIAAGDLNGDGTAEYIFGLSGRGGLYFLDDQGVVHSKAARPFTTSVVILDIDGDGTREVLHAGGGEMVSLDSQGTVVARDNLASFAISEFSLATGRDGKPRVAQLTEGVLSLSRPNGTEVQRIALPEVNRGRGLRLVWIRFQPDGDVHLAVSCRGDVRDHLFVLDSKGTVVHYERIAGEELPLGVLQRPGRREALLVGTADGLWLYEQ